MPPSILRPAALCCIVALSPSSAFAHDKTAPASGAAHPEGTLSPGARWLAGDHHIHSRYSVGYDEKASPPAPVIGKPLAWLKSQL